MEADDAYRNKIAMAVYEAIVAASRGEGDAAVVKTGSAFDALMLVAALLIAGDPNLATPQAVRLFSENEGKKLQKQILAAQTDPERPALFRDEYDPRRTN